MLIDNLEIWKSLLITHLFVNQHPPINITVIYLLYMFLIALREDNGVKHERVVVMQVVRVGQVTGLTNRWHIIHEGLPEQALFAPNYVTN